MLMITIVLSACVLLSAGVAIWSDAKGRLRLFRIAKPLTTILIIVVAALAAAPVPAEYKTLVLAGLMCSLLGDIALAAPKEWFMAGLVAFLAAQIFYMLAFRPRPGHSVSAGAFLPFVFYGLLMYFLLAPGLGKLKIPVLVYIGAITIMAGFAAGRFVDLGGTRPFLAFAGAVLFMISDSVLAYDRFGRKMGPAQTIILGTYFPAQLLIALSI